MAVAGGLGLGCPAWLLWTSVTTVNGRCWTNSMSTTTRCCAVVPEMVVGVTESPAETTLLVAARQGLR